MGDFDSSNNNSASPPLVPEFESDRTSERRKVLKGARIGFNHEFSSVECVIRNISETGAYITVQDDILVPNHFTLFNELDKYKVDCEIVWRHGNAFGVHFSGQKIVISSKRSQVLSQYTPVGGNPDDTMDTDTSSQPTRFVSAPRPAFGKRK